MFAIMSPGLLEAVKSRCGGGGGVSTNDKSNVATTSEGTKMSKEAIPSVSKVQGNKTDDCSKPEVDKDLYYFPVDKVTEQDMKTAKKKKVEVNGETIALISHDNKIFAIQEKCPHYGGPLHQGDIEDLPQEGPCIRCPWHSWKFSLTTGKCVSPQREDKCLKMYPVKVSKDSKEIKIGFEKLADTIFSTPP